MLRPTGRKIVFTRPRAGAVGDLRSDQRRLRVQERSLDLYEYTA